MIPGCEFGNDASFKQRLQEPGYYYGGPSGCPVYFAQALSAAPTKPRRVYGEFSGSFCRVGGVKNHVPPAVWRDILPRVTFAGEPAIHGGKKGYSTSVTNK